LPRGWSLVARSPHTSKQPARLAVLNSLAYTPSQ
jgi:hypothetical protein